jgi:hypothetical protein
MDNKIGIVWIKTQDKGAEPMRKKYAAWLLFLMAILLLTGCEPRKETSEVTVNNLSFEASVLSMEEDGLLVEPSESTIERKLYDEILILTEGISEEQSIETLKEIAAGDVIAVGYHGAITEGEPARIDDAYEIKMVTKGEGNRDQSSEAQTDETVPNAETEPAPNLVLSKSQYDITVVSPIKILVGIHNRTTMEVKLTNFSEQEYTYGEFYFRLPSNIPGWIRLQPA